MARGPQEWDDSNDETEFFERPNTKGSYGGYGSDETQVFRRPDSDHEVFPSWSGQDRQETEFLDRPNQQPTDQTPRQQFPPGYDPVSGTYAPGYGQQGYQESPNQQGVPPHYQGPQYQQPAQPPQSSQQTGRRKAQGGSGGLIALGFLAGLALVAAIVFFLMWRGSEDKPASPPVTETATVTQTKTVEKTPEREPILPTEFPTELPDLPSDIIPTELPELPSEVRDFDVEGFVNDLLGNNDGAADQPAPPAQ